MHSLIVLLTTVFLWKNQVKTDFFKKDSSRFSLDLGYLHQKLRSVPT